MLATFQVDDATLTLADDLNFGGEGKIGFVWEEWSVSAQVVVTPLFDSAIPSKRAFGNLDRKLGFRAQRSFIGSYSAAISALTSWLQTVDSQCGQAGTLTLKPDANESAALVYENCILKSVTLVTGQESTRGVMATVSYRFEPITLS